MQNVSGFGFLANIVADKTLSSGADINIFADDGDPFDIQSIDVADFAMTLNGDLVTWSKATPITVVLNVLPGSEDDKNLSAILEANMVGKGKTPVRDIITLSGIYPDGSSVTLSNGGIKSGMPGNGIASSGRQKTKPYTFVFEQISKTSGV